MVALFVLLTFLLFIGIDLIVLRAQKKTHPAFEPSVQDFSVFSKESLAVPEKYFVSKGHTWAERNEYGLIKVGVDELILKALGQLKLDSTVVEGKHIKQGDVIFEGLAGGRKLQFRSPVTGKVDFVNHHLLGKQISDPYGDGWGILVTADNYHEDQHKLLTGTELKKWMNSEFNRLKDFLHTHSVKPELAGVTMYDGGNVVEGALSSITEAGISDFEKEFLTF